MSDDPATGPYASFEQDVAYIAERLRETYTEEGVEIVLGHLRRARADADLAGYHRGRREALLEAMAVAERFTARATAARIRDLHDETPASDSAARS